MMILINKILQKLGEIGGFNCRIQDNLVNVKNVPKTKTAMTNSAESEYWRSIKRKKSELEEEMKVWQAKLDEALMCQWSVDNYIACNIITC